MQFMIHAGKVVKEIAAEMITENSFSDIPAIRQIIFFGDGAAKCREVIKRDNVYFADDFRISASHMQKPVYQAVNRQAF